MTRPWLYPQPGLPVVVAPQVQPPPPSTSTHTLFDSLEDLPPRTTNPPLPRPSFKSIERLANQPPPLPAMEPPLPPFPPHLSPIGPNNPFLMLTHEMFCEHCQRTQVVVDNLCDEM
ncbi:hypothetical protein Tco_1077980 [Tanacetum coccineum]